MLEFETNHIERKWTSRNASGGVTLSMGKALLTAARLDSSSDIVISVLKGGGILIRRKDEGEVF